MMIPSRPLGLHFSSLEGLGATVDDLASAIAKFEGYGTPGVWATINNNPGNLRSGTGQTGTNGGFAVFATPADGFAALDNQIEINEGMGLNLNQFFGGLPGVYPGYAPAADSNNPAAYATTVASWIGIDPTVPLTQVLSPSSDSSTTGDLSDSLDGGVSQDDSLLGGLSGTTWALAGLGLIGLAYAFRR
jgi:hypothetical protein